MLHAALSPTMLKLLTATATAAVLMAGPAMAVDYVKCEAIQKALDHTRSELRAVMKVVAPETSEKYMMTY